LLLRKIRIFLQKGLDNQINRAQLICPSGKSACAPELAGGGAGNGAALQAGPADIDALIELAGVVHIVSLRDTGTLLVRILGFLRTGGKTDSHGG
jgi:hypothetical protein